MSRIGNQPINIPQDVEITITDNSVTVQGPQGKLSRAFHPDMTITRGTELLTVSRPSEEREHKALHGLTRSLLANMVTGVSKGFARSLELVGVGYRVQQNGSGLTLSIMLSHPVEFEPLPGIQLEVEGNNRIHVRGTDKQVVGEMAARIRKARPPNAYTGKGIRYLGEQIRLKPGKSARRA